jgi:hypothetical protein
MGTFYENNQMPLGTPTFSEAVSGNLRKSSYTISVKLEVEEDKYMLFHGYTGAIDVVTENVVNYLNNKGVELGYGFMTVTNGYDLDKFTHLLGSNKIMANIGLAIEKGVDPLRWHNNYRKLIKQFVKHSILTSKFSEINNTAKLVMFFDFIMKTIRNTFASILVISNNYIFKHLRKIYLFLKFKIY